MSQLVGFSTSQQAGLTSALYRADDRSLNVDVRFLGQQPSGFGGKFLKSIVGITRDDTGAALGSCIVKLFRTATDVMLSQVTSDGSGNYAVPVYDDAQYYAVAYKAGAPDVSGTTLNTLVGS